MMSVMEFRSSIPDTFRSYLDDDDQNSFCFDCNQENPDWASLGFGIFICLECAGKHRSLGVHLTLVKSLILDRWEEKQHLYMKHGGNNRFREYVQPILDQQQLPSNSDSIYRIAEVIYYKELLESIVEGRDAKPRDHVDMIVFYKKVVDGSSSPTRSSSSPTWTSDKISQSCMLCDTSFTLFKRRHHCRRCGRIACHDCAPKNNTRPIPEWGLREPVRHCKSCYRSPAIAWT